jgi:polyhydroxyalkanoate synthesis repressor PhaR
MSEKRIIKKYPNRRLYDTAISSYITLEDVRRLVLDDVIVQVIDARTKDDLTHNTLLQIMVDQEERQTPLFTTEMLQRLIRIYGASYQLLLRQMLEQSFALFSQQQFVTKENGDKSVDSPTAFMHQLTEENVKSWQALQEKAIKEGLADKAIVTESNSEINN